jgi:hypothetical protein
MVVGQRVAGEPVRDAVEQAALPRAADPGGRTDHGRPRNALPVNGA